MKEVHVVGAAILDGEKVLAAQRSIHMGAPLKWEFPGGKVEEGENHTQALQRELQEELGVKVEVNGPLAAGTVNDEDNDRVIVLHVYETEISEGTPVAKEHAQLKWIEIDDMGELDWAEADIPACKELMRRYGSTCWCYTCSRD